MLHRVQQILLILMLFSLTTYAMDNQILPIHYADDRPYVAEIISSEKLPIFECKINCQQQKILKKVLIYNDFYRGSFEMHELSAQVCCCASILGLMIAGGMTIYAASENNKRLIMPVLLSWIGSLLPTMVFLVGAVRHACRKKQAHNVFQRYLLQGQHSGLGAVAAPLVDLLDNGCKGHFLCYELCYACARKRLECSICRNFYTLPNGAVNRNICRDCWTTKCLKCSTCSRQRDLDRFDVLRSQLDPCPQIDMHNNNLKLLKCYLQALMKKQSKEAEFAV
jgi:hypothetical protein